MDAIVNEHFARLESSFNALVDSITTYNPNPATAAELVAADGHLSQCLEQLATHQANHAYIQQLQRTSRSLVEHTRSNLRTLATARSELSAAAASTPLSKREGVNLDDLLSYARRISKFTTPPTQLTDPSTFASRSPSAQPTQANSNGIKTEPSTANPAAPTNSTDKLPSTQDDTPNIGVDSLSQEQKAWLDPRAQYEFVPWPSDDVIRSGGLAQLAHSSNSMSTHDTRPMDGEGSTQPNTSQEEVGTTTLGRVSTNTGSHREHQPSRQLDEPSAFSSLDLYDPDEGD